MAGKNTPAPYTPEFEAAWQLYPKISNNSKRAAFKAWTARINQGFTPEEMVAGLKAYLAWLDETGTPTKLAATFFGPGLHFQSEYTAGPSPKKAPADTLLRFYEQEKLV